MSARDVVDEVVQWDVTNGGTLGALIRCKACPCRWGTGCDGTGVLFRDYLLPDGGPIDLWGRADVVIQLLDRPNQEPMPSD